MRTALPNAASLTGQLIDSYGGSGPYTQSNNPSIFFVSTLILGGGHIRETNSLIVSGFLYENRRNRFTPKTGMIHPSGLVTQ